MVESVEVAITLPFALVERSALVRPVIAKLLEVACASVVLPETARVPWRMEFPVVVAPPEMVRPPVCVPLPMVVEAKAVRPPLNCVRVEVALPARANGYPAIDGVPVSCEYGKERLGSVVMPEIEDDAERRLSKSPLKVVV